MRIFPKLLLALLLTSFTLLLVLYALMQWGIDRGMLNYVNQRQMQSLQLVSENLASVYQEHNSWQHVVASSVPPQEPGKSLRQRGKLSPKRVNGREPRRSALGLVDNHKPIHQRRNDTGIKYWRIVLRLSEKGLKYPDDIEQLMGDRRPNSRDKNNRSAPARPKLKESKQARLRFALLNAKKQVLIGRYNEDFVQKSILLDDEVIGYVALPPAEQITNKFDLEFVEDINQQVIMILIGVFLVIVIMTIPLSRHFIGPITRLKNAVILVNQGELSTRLPIAGNDELATLARNFNDLAATLEQNEGSRKRWLADIAHELRTPLAIIKGELEAMEDGIRPINIGNISSLTEEVSHLQSLINDLNELNQAEIGAMRYQKSELDINKLIRLNAERHAALLKNKGLQLTVDYTQ